MTDNPLALIATEALKPVSSIIDVFLEPTLIRMRKRAKKRALRNRLDAPEINEVLDQYFKRLLRRVSGIRTIVFPERAVPLTSIYEPLYLKEVKYKITRTYGVSFTPDRKALRAKDLEAGQNYLIIDSAGMGKSTYVKHLVLDIFQFTNKIPLFLELRRIAESETLLGRLAKEIDATQDDIDESFLALLLEEGIYVIILDGYDELSENVRQKIGIQIQDLAVNYGQNTLVLTSRPQVPIPEIPTSTTYNIEPLERSQAESLVLRYDAFADLDVGKGLIGQFDSVSQDYLHTPLLIILLYRTYSYNHTIAAKVTAFYDDVYDAFYKGHDLTKSGFSRPKLSGLDSDSFRKLLQAFSFILLTEGKNSLRNEGEAYDVIEKAAQVTSITPSSAIAFFEDLLLSVPFLVRDGNEFHFIHKSLCEFFAAEYLTFAPDAEKKIRMIRKGGMSPTFITCFSFLAEIHPSLFRRCILAPVATEFLSPKKYIANELLNTLRMFGITEVAITRGSSSFPKSKEAELFPIDVSIAVGSISFRFRFYRHEDWHPYKEIRNALFRERTLESPSAVDLFTTIGIPRYPKKIEFSREEIKEIRGTKNIVQFRSDDALILIKNRIFFYAAIQALHLVSTLNSRYVSLDSLLDDIDFAKYEVIDEGVCRTILRTVRQEQKASSQINALLSIKK